MKFLLNDEWVDTAEVAPFDLVACVEQAVKNLCDELERMLNESKDNTST